MAKYQRNLNDLSDSLCPLKTRTTAGEASRRETAEPVQRIFDAETGVVVGWLYKWNTGALVPMWKDGRVDNVVYQ